MKGFLMGLRMLVGMAQSALLFGGCAGMFTPDDYTLTTFCIAGFIVACVVQVGIVLLVALFAKVSGDYTE